MKILFLFLMLSLNVFANDIYEIKLKDYKGQEASLSPYKGKVLLIVNIASQCGFTSQLGDLEKLYQTYKEKGLVVLGFPSNDFGGQAPEADEEFKTFCEKKYSVTFPIFKKDKVIGKERQALYQYFKDLKNKDLNGDVAWNFEKFVIDRKGNVVDRFSSFRNPDASKIKDLIEKLLKD
jgi:glutathione peroxidase